MIDRETLAAADLVRRTPIHLDADTMPPLPWEDAEEEDAPPPWWEPWLEAAAIWALIGALCLAAITLAHFMP